MNKIELLEQKIKEGKISLEEALVLMGEEKRETVFVPYPVRFHTR